MTREDFDKYFPPTQISADDTREYILRRLYDEDVLVTMRFRDDGKKAELFIPADHRAAVAAAVAPTPAPGEPTAAEIEAFEPTAITLTLSRDEGLVVYGALNDMRRMIWDERTTAIRDDLMRRIAKQRWGAAVAAIIAPPASGDVTDAEVEAAAKAWFIQCFNRPDFGASAWERVDPEPRAIHFKNARIALVAARAARATGASE